MHVIYFLNTLTNTWIHLIECVWYSLDCVMMLDILDSTITLNSSLSLNCLWDIMLTLFLNNIIFQWLSESSLKMKTTFLLISTKLKIILNYVKQWSVIFWQQTWLITSKYYKILILYWLKWKVIKSVRSLNYW